jgi:SEC-C motif-containing protein
MAKIGRNDPCPCGSGKKYKHCCFGKEIHSSIPEGANEDPEWLKIRVTEGEVTEEILVFGVKQYGENFLKDTFHEFGLWGEFSVDDAHIESIFIQWLAFNWLPETVENGSAEVGEQPLGMVYLDEHAARLDDYQQRFIRTACTQPFSFSWLRESFRERVWGFVTSSWIERSRLRKRRHRQRSIAETSSSLGLCGWTARPSL